MNQTQERVCQFYIIIGDKEFIVPRDGNVYINATGVLDNNLIREAIYRAYGKKSSEKVKVGNEIIFLIPSMEFQTRCQEIISALGIRAKIQILPSKRVEVQNQAAVIGAKDVEQYSESNNKVSGEMVHNEVVQSVNTSVTSNEVQKPELKVLSSSNSNLEQPSKPKNVYVYRPENNSQFDVVDNGGMAFGGMVAEGPTQTQGNVKKLVKSPSSHKSAAFVSLPVIMFVLSAMMLIASVVILFVLE